MGRDPKARQKTKGLFPESQLFKPTPKHSKVDIKRDYRKVTENKPFRDQAVIQIDKKNTEFRNNVTKNKPSRDQKVVQAGIKNSNF